MDENRAAELAQAIQQIRERVAARHPTRVPGHVPIPLVDLSGLLHARDAAEAKVAAIGTVNPRPPGLANDLVQWVKRTLARSLNWLWRDQVEFNRQQMAAIQATLDSLNDFNRLAVDISSRIDGLLPRLEEAEFQARELADVQTHWSTWRHDWERKLSTNEIQFLRSVADIQASFHQKTAQQEEAYRAQAVAQHRAFESALQQANLEIQKTVWTDMRQVKLEYQRVIHEELRMARLRAMATSSNTSVSSTEEVDSWWFSEKFRGTEEYVRSCFLDYVDRFRTCQSVLDIGCGRGEFLELMKEAGVLAQGIDSNPELVGHSRNKGLAVEEADLFEYLHRADGPLWDGIFCSQVVEHLPPARLPEFFQACATRMRPGGILLIETPNPECLVIFSTHFYLDPTHTKPVPAQLLTFYLGEAGFGEIQVEYRQPAENSFPELESLPEDLRKRFFGGLDTSVTAIRL